ncbi:PepSY domain-containing protein [Actinomadura sp. HBU206391]|uniref:PepSY domain-containing protein n=1 Tax=Actinomadura sp. HBU206391 TaxID=2731692 RepID=UPI00164F5728|nr:PepSY domain-containing protein [Actinomadura sp. HBU206391]MBC6460993.1 PepSY domain-containing protein [Actinomadura sp. HBU206391]
MERRNKTIIVAATTVAVIGAGISAATAGGGEEPDRPITGAALDKASAAALKHAGGGKVTETEIEEDGTYEVEITRPDGSEIEVNLDRDFHVIGSESGESDEE